MFEPRMAQAPAVQPSRSRHPLGHANNLPAPGMPPPKAGAQPKPRNPNPAAPGEPPLQRQNVKTTPPSPPQVIRDPTRGADFVRIGLLGEGGFARVYEVKDSRGARVACKVITKESLKTKKAKTKLYAEIKIHRALSHPNVVRFKDCFEDDGHVYMTLELCHNGSLMDMLRRRRRFTEPESRFFMVQILGACYYMHTNQVIHRDLKLGNLFLDADMNVKVGDFGLAALIETPGERKKTICGTPNYIAPEVLFDTANGHSFEVDTWSVGVILYTMVVGKPPFQTKDVKAIYQRIRENDYEFPTDRPVSTQVRELVQATLTPDPEARPALHEILDDVWFTHGTVPAYIPASAHDEAPDFRHLSRAASQANLARLRRNSFLDADQVATLDGPLVEPTPASSAAATIGSSVPPTGRLKTATSSLAQQEKEFHHAVQPGSPISALLKSARQPLVVAPSPKPTGETPLLRKLQAAQKERHARDAVTAPAPADAQRLQQVEEDEDAEDEAPRAGASKGRRERDAEQSRKKELESQKARIVAQMVPAPLAPGDDGARLFGSNADGVAVAPIRRATAGAAAPSPDPGAEEPVLRANTFDSVALTLTAAFEARAAGRPYRDPRDRDDLPDERVFIVSWVDYCNKYGMGYALTDGSVGVHFNDSTTLVLAPDKHHFDYISSRRQGSAYVRKGHTVSEYPEELKSKVYLLKHFERYIMDRLYGEYEYTFEDVDKTRGMNFVQKYLRMKHVIVFKMSHDALQFNFYDHSKVIISADGLRITHIDKNYELTRWRLADVIATSLAPPSSDPDQAKFDQRLVDKLKYCRDVLVSIKNASEDQGAEKATVSAAKPLERHASKALLR